MAKQIITYTTVGSHTWTPPNNIKDNEIEVLIVAGGGGGGADNVGAGGGAGGLIHNVAMLVTSGQDYTIIVGDGGAGAASRGDGTNGEDSSAFGFTAVGGGAGGGGGWSSPNAGHDGGSGGGGAGGDSGATPGGSGTTGQGNDGGSGYGTTYTSRRSGGGGGGAGTSGQSASSYNGGDGGDGVQKNTSGSTEWYAGGGGGATNDGSGKGIGGSGIGGDGTDGGGSATSGAVNTGSGGGGIDDGASYPAGDGGSGIVIIRYEEIAPWLSDWTKRRKITIDNTNIDSDLTHFPVPIPLGTSVGQSNQDVSDIFIEISGGKTDLTFGKAHYSDNIYGLSENMADDDFSTYCQNMTYVAVENINAAVSKISLAVHNSAALSQLQSDEPILEGSNNSTDGSDGDWALITQIMSTDCLAPTSYPGYVVNKEFINNNKFEWYRISGITSDNNNVYNEWEMFAVNESLRIAVTKDDGITEIYTEVEQWDEVNQKALLWVSKDDLTITSASVTELYLYFDSSKADNTAYVGIPGSRPEVWDSDFTAVYTMAQDPSGGTDCIIDSTGNANHGTPNGSFSSSDLIDGLIGKAIHFQGNDTGIELLNESSFDAPGDLTVEVFERWDGVNTDRLRVVSKNADAWRQEQLSGDEPRLDFNGVSFNAGEALSQDSWAYVSTKINSTESRIWIDDHSANTGGGGFGGSDGDNVWIGAEAGGFQNSERFSGDIAGVRVSVGKYRSDTYNKAGHHALIDDLLTWKDVEYPIIATNSPSNIEFTSTTLNGTLSNLQGESSLDVYFEWGTDTSYGNTTPIQTISSIPTSFSAGISSLLSFTTYHCRAVATNGVAVWYGNDFQFTTLASWLSGWWKRRKIIIDNTNIDSDLTHFPVPIPLGTAVGQSSQDVSDIFDEIGSESLKIAVTKSDGTTQIYAEVEQWDSINQKALLWVSKDDLTLTSASVTELYLYFDSNRADNTDYIGTPGNRPEVWNSYFAAVYTMAQDPDGGADSIIDSSGNGNHGTSQGSMTSGDLVDGQIGKAIDFDGSDDFIEIPNDSTLEPNVLSLSTWIKPSDSLPNQWYFITGKTSFWDPYEYGLYIHYQYPGFHIRDNNDLTWDQALSVDTWYRIVGTYDGSTARLYINGEEVGSFSHTTTFSNSHPFTIGKSTSQPYYFLGKIDETCLCSINLTNAWIKADYHAQTDNLLTFGTYEASPKFYCNGTVRDSSGLLASDIQVNLYRRLSGELVESTVTTSSGTFSMNSRYDEYHYIVALYSDNTKNALIYDYIAPTTSGGI